MNLKSEDQHVVINNLSSLANARRVSKKKDKTIIWWQDREDFTETFETFKTLDAIYSFLIALPLIKPPLSVEKGQDKRKNQNPLGRAMAEMDHDLQYVFRLIEKDGFFPLPYLWTWGKPFDLMDMASLSCELCTLLLTEKYSFLSNSTIESARTVLKKSVDVIRNSVSKFPGGQYAWKGWGKLSKAKDNRSPRLKGSTDLTSLCCTALSKYLQAWDAMPTAMDMGFNRGQISELIQGGVAWVMTRYDTRKKNFYKYDDENEQALYWGAFALSRRR